MQQVELTQTGGIQRATEDSTKDGSRNCSEQEGGRLGWRSYVTSSDAACTSTEDKDWQGQWGSKETFGFAVKTLSGRSVQLCSQSAARILQTDSESKI